MSKIAIGAEASQWDGLQIDLLQKHRQGHVTPNHLKWFLGLKASERNALAVGGKLPPKVVAPRKRPEKFELLADLGVITVPEDHASSLVFAGLNFSNPSRVLKPGDKLLLRAYKQIVPGTTTSKERMSYLERREEGNVYVGAQGIELILGQKKDLLPKGFWYASFDKKRNLPEVSGGDRGVPSVSASSDGDFNRYLDCLERVWYGSNAFLGFSDFIE